MKRKTNLFYDFGKDSNFLTFSNYTEAMTGNFVSTNTKLYPSKFLCLYLPSLEEDGETAKTKLIQEYLCGRYENRLAFLRDKLIEKNEGSYKNTYTIESKLASLGYLLKDIYEFDNGAQIVYLGEISEQDFNGTYTDTICLVDSLRYKGVVNDWPEEKEYKEKDVFHYIDIRDEEGEVVVSGYDNPLSNKLYGWYYLKENEETKELEVETLYETLNLDIVPEGFDGEDEDGLYYDRFPVYESLDLYDVTVDNNLEAELKFNVIIPLFDIINNDYKTNIEVLKETYEINLLPNEKSNEEGIYNPPYISNVPLGIWFSPNVPVTLYRDLEKGYAQSWSLVIGSQFKPFPYMTNIPNEIDRDSISGAYSTFAQIMSNQNNLTEKLNEILNTVNDLSKRVTQIENTINNCPGLNTDAANNLMMQFLDYKNEVNQIINNFQQQLNSTQLRWINREG